MPLVFVSSLQSFADYLWYLDLLQSFADYLWYLDLPFRVLQTTCGIWIFPSEFCRLPVVFGSSLQSFADYLWYLDLLQSFSDYL